MYTFTRTTLHQRTGQPVSTQVYHAPTSEAAWRMVKRQEQQLRAANFRAYWTIEKAHFFHPSGKRQAVLITHPQRDPE